jgi:hypothetical protein
MNAWEHFSQTIAIIANSGGDVISSGTKAKLHVMIFQPSRRNDPGDNGCTHAEAQSPPVR